MLKNSVSFGRYRFGIIRFGIIIWIMIRVGFGLRSNLPGMCGSGSAKQYLYPSLLKGWSDGNPCRGSLSDSGKSVFFCRFLLPSCWLWFFLFRGFDDFELPPWVADILIGQKLEIFRINKYWILFHQNQLFQRLHRNSFPKISSANRRPWNFWCSVMWRVSAVKYSIFRAFIPRRLFEHVWQDDSEYVPVIFYHFV